MWYCLDSSRLSKVVRVARFHYSPVVDRGIPLERRGESLPLRGWDEERRAEIKDWVLRSDFFRVDSVPIRFWGFNLKGGLTSEHEQILITCDKQIGISDLCEVEERLIAWIAAIDHTVPR